MGKPTSYSSLPRYPLDCLQAGDYFWCWLAPVGVCQLITKDIQCEKQHFSLYSVRVRYLTSYGVEERIFIDFPDNMGTWGDVGIIKL